MALFTFPQIAGVFNIFVGIMLTISILLLGAGIVVWFVRLGTYPTYRDLAIELMKWSVTVLFALVLLLLLSQFIQQHTATAVFILGFIIIGLIVWVLIKESQGGSGGGDTHH